MPWSGRLRARVRPTTGPVVEVPVPAPGSYDVGPVQIDVDGSDTELRWSVRALAPAPVAIDAVALGVGRGAGRPRTADVRERVSVVVAGAHDASGSRSGSFPRSATTGFGARGVPRGPRNRVAGRAPIGAGHGAGDRRGHAVHRVLGRRAPRRHDSRTDRRQPGGGVRGGLARWRRGVRLGAGAASGRDRER